MYSWGSTELDVIRNSYVPFTSTSNGIQIIELLPSVDKSRFTSVLQQGNRSRKVASFEGITNDFSLIRSLETDFMNATQRIFIDRLGESHTCIISTFTVSSVDWTGTHRYHMELMETEEV